jgi:hypothetical protein
MAQHFQYLVIYYSPDTLRGAKINLGLILLAAVAEETAVRFISDWQRIHSLHPDGDIEVVKAICRDIEQQVKRGDAAEIVRMMEDSFSNTIQVSARMDCVGRDPDEAMNTLTVLYLTR